jgi:hypothetical protein
MNFTNENEAAAQSLLLTENSAEEFSGAIRNARMALKSGSIDYAITRLEKASRRAGEVGDHRASELANCRFPPRFDPGFPLRTDPA